MVPLPTCNQNSDATLLLFPSADVGVNLPPGSPQLYMSTGGLVAESCLTLVIPWAVARQAPLSMEFFQARILKWLPISFPRESSDPGIKPGYPALQAYSLLTALPGKPDKRTKDILFLFTGD